MSRAHAAVSSLAFVVAFCIAFSAAAQESVPEVARQKLAEANRHRESERHDDAIARYREVIDLAPSLIDAYVGLGAIYHQQQAYERALEVFEQGLARFPEDATLLFNAAATEVRLERLERAIDYADRAARANPDDPAIHTLRGTVLRRLGRLDEAIAAFRTLVERDPRNARGYYNLGNVYYQAERKEEALDAYREAIAIDRDLLPAHYNRGAVLFELARYDEALEAYEVALAPIDEDFADGKSVPSSHARAYLNLGAIYLHRKSLDRSLDAYRKAVTLDPSNAAAQYNLGYIHYQLGDDDQAYEAYRRTTELDESLPLSYLHMGLIDFERDRMEAAVRWLDQAVARLDGDDRNTAELTLAQAYQALGQAARAEEHYRVVLGADPSEVKALVGLGRILREQQRMAEARPLLEQARTIVLDNSGVAIELAALARADGDVARERSLYEEALKRDGHRPEMWPVRVNLVSVLLRTGARTEARREMESLMGQRAAIESVSAEAFKQVRTAHALVLAQDGDLAVASKELGEVLKQDPDFTPAANAVAALVALQGKLDEASQQWMRLAPRTGGTSLDILVRANLGEALWLVGRADQAREHLLAAAEAFPENPILRAALGEIELAGGDSAAAVRELRAAEESCRGEGTTRATSTGNVLRLTLYGNGESSPCGRVRSALGLALLTWAGEKISDPGARREATRLVDESLSYALGRGAQAQALFVRGTLALLEGDDARARTDLQQALELGLAESLVASAHNNLGVALYGAGATVQARESFERARASRLAPATLNLAIYLDEAKEKEQALALYDEYVASGGAQRDDATRRAESIRRVYR